MSAVVHGTCHAAPETNAVRGRDLFSVHHTISQFIRLAVCAGSHGSVLQQRHGSHRTYPSHNDLVHHLPLLDHRECCWIVVPIRL